MLRHDAFPPHPFELGGAACDLVSVPNGARTGFNEVALMYVTLATRPLRVKW